jgi:hypothetical protein
MLSLTLRKGHWLCIGALWLVASCGGSPSGGTDSQASSADNDQPAASATAAPSAKLPTADEDVPLSDYFELEGAHQLASLYYALSELPPDMDLLARISSNEYAYTSDAFRKQDLLKALEPRLLAELERAKTQRYFWTDYQGVCLGHYDMTTKQFPVNGGPTADSYLFFDNNREFKLSFTNSDAHRSLAVADEARARDLEARVSQGSACGNLRVYLFAQGIDLRSKTLQSQIVKAQLYDYQRRLITDL